MDAPDDFYSTGYTEASDLIMTDDAPVIDPSESAHSIVDPTSTLHTQFSRSNKHWMQIPVDSSLVPRDGAIFQELTDDEILQAPTGLLVHVMRTAASGGLQVISPRQTPLGATMGHTDHTNRTSDMHLTGSVASRDLEWPVVRRPLARHLFPGEPIDGGPQALGTSRRTRTVGIKVASPELSDPVVAAFVGARALVDLQSRPDVGGAARDLSDLVAAAWNVDPEVFAHLSEASIAPEGPLLRYAARADGVFPRVHAPVQARLCISVAAHATGRLVYGEHAAVDWARGRVLCAAVFYMSSRLEGHTLMDMRLTVPPGNFSADPRRAGVLQMRPLPGAVWSFAPRSFAIMPTPPVGEVAAANMPERVTEAMRRYDDSARPVSIAIAMGATVSAARSIVVAIPRQTPETVAAGYISLMTRMTTFAGRGRTAAAMARDYLYHLLENNHHPDAIRLVWAAKELRVLIPGYAVARDDIPNLAQKLARRIVALSTDIRRSLGAEAVRRKSTMDEWWDDMRSSLPLPLKSLKEGSTSWVIAATYYLIMPPTDRWARLTRALAHASIRTLGDAHVRAMRLPATARSAARIWEAAEGGLRGLASGYGAYYSAVADACNLVADILPKPARRAHSNQLRAAAAFWAIRASFAQNIELVQNRAVTGSDFWMAVEGYVFTLKTDAGPAYLNWRSKALADRNFPRALVRASPAQRTADPRTIFAAMTAETPTPACVCRATRYYFNPSRLANDLYTQAQEMMEDVGAVIRRYSTEDLPSAATNMTFSAVDLPVSAENVAEFARYTSRPLPGAALNYWRLLAALDELQFGLGEDCEARVQALPGDDAARMEAGQYASTDEFLAELQRSERAAEATTTHAYETVA